MFLKAFSVVVTLSIVLAPGVSCETRIAGGTPTSIYSYPFVVSVVYSGDVDVPKCIGSLISSWHVLTTAYCFSDTDYTELKIRAGSTSSLEGGVLVSINDVNIHPDYVTEPRTADIAIVTLTNYLAITDNIRLVYIPPQETFIPEGYGVQTLGWEYNSDVAADSDSLLILDTNTISEEQCSAAYVDDEAVNIYDQVLCTKAENSGLCNSNTGAPLILGEVLVGVASYFTSCDGSTPDVYSRVDRHTGWILEHAVAPQSS